MKCSLPCEPGASPARQPAGKSRRFVLVAGAFSEAKTPSQTSAAIFHQETPQVSPSPPAATAASLRVVHRCWDSKQNVERTKPVCPQAVTRSCGPTAPHRRGDKMTTDEMTLLKGLPCEWALRVPSPQRKAA